MPLSTRFRQLPTWLVVLVLVLWTSTAHAQIIRRGRPNGKGGVALPYQTGDGHGQNWLIYQAAMIQMQGNFPVYQQAGTITINGNQPNVQPTARIDEKTN